MDEVREQVRQRYALAAVQGGDEGCCGGGPCAPESIVIDGSFGAGLYSAVDAVSIPPEALAASLGCGNPMTVAELRAGERVLDLGSGGRIDVLLSARRVGPTGFAYGVDMTDEMLDLARANALKAGATNVEFRKGTIEELPVEDATVDVVISNCVINLAADKPAVFREIARVLRPGGRVGVSDIVADDALSPAERAERGSFAGCIAGALSFAEYAAGLEAAGLTAVEIEATHPVADGLYGAIIRARRPGVDAAPRASRILPMAAQPVTDVPVTAAAGSSCCGGTGCC